MGPVWSPVGEAWSHGLVAQVSRSWGPLELTLIFADLVTFLAYAVIPLVIIYSLLRRRRVHFSWVWFLLLVYLVIGGAVHVFSALGEAAENWTAVLKVALAFVSWVWVLVLFPLVPRLLEARSAEEFTHL